MSAAENVTEGTNEAKDPAVPLERRISPDGGDYTYEEFVGFFGKEDAKWYWEQAEISSQVNEG